MKFVLVLIFAVTAALALGFVCWPLWRNDGKGRAILAGSLAAFVLAIAAGAYIFVGHPEMALRTLEKPQDDDARALVSKLAWRMRQSPNDPRGWLVLGRAYLALGDAEDSALAFKRAVQASPPAEKVILLSDYGMALTAAAGAVTPDAEAAFREVLAQNPQDVMARFYLGEAYAERRDAKNALSIWKGLLADTPANAPWRAALIDRIAIVEGAAPQASPDIQAMVEGLAERLKAHPDDAAGWQRLLKAYVVLGETGKAHAALGNARHALAKSGSDMAAIEAEARALHLEN